MKFHILPALFILSIAIVSAQSPLPDATRESDQASANFGYAVSSAGDVNGDGFDDVIVGAYNYDAGQTNEGRVFIYHGSATGIPLLPTITLECDQANASFGFSLSSAGDVNGDGFSDIIVGAPLYDAGQINEGRVFIYHGSATGILSSPAVTIESNQSSAYFGQSISKAGDINNDGYDDIIVGAHQYDNGQTDEGRVYIYTGSVTGINPLAASILESDQSMANLGYTVSSAGDINGDGFDDVLAGAYRFDNGETNEGRCYVWQGSAAGISTAPSAIIEMNQAYAYFGISVSDAGDTDNDGFDDIIVGATLYDLGQTNEGAAFIFLGSAGGVSSVPADTLQSNQADASFGNSVACAGDINNDGYDDVIVGSHNFDNDLNDEGRVYTYLGGPSGINIIPLQPFECDQVNANLGFSVAGAGDLNGDDYDDIIAGAYNFDNGQTNEGRIYIWNGYSCTMSVFYEDKDVDGFGNTDFPVLACSSPAGFVIDGTDCNDGNMLINPSTLWYMDEDADHYYTSTSITQCTSPGTHYIYEGVSGGGDCVDTDIRINPGLSELLDGIDNNCNGDIDDGLSWTFGGVLEAGNDEGFGLSVADAGDINNDGYEDVIAGARAFKVDEDPAGRVYIYYGSPSGIPGEPSVILQGSENEEFGSSVAGAGDINGDGYDDIIVGAHYYTNGEFQEGAIYIFNGSASGILPEPSAQVESNRTFAEYGHAVSAAGDVNGDGFDDIIVSLHVYTNGQSNEGAVYVYLGSSSGIGSTPPVILESNISSVYFGSSVSCAGDMNADGFDDVIIGTTNSHGRAYVYYGTSAGITATGFKLLDWLQTGSGFGSSVDGAGDINNDGYDDVIIGASGFDGGQTDEGWAFIYFGSDTGVVTAGAAYDYVESNQAGAYFGSSVSGVGDVDGDGFDDIFIGAYRYDNLPLGEGRAFLYRGSAAGINSDPYITMGNDQINSIYGGVVSGTGDVDGDGHKDVAVGAYQYHLPGDIEGAIFIYYFNSGCVNTYFADADGDTYGNPSDSVITCLLPDGYVTNNLDCNDADALQNPATVWYNDFDGDHFSSGDSVTQCMSPDTGYSFLAMEGSDDCDNTEAAIYPGADELQDGIDNNCDGLTDEGLELIADDILYSHEFHSNTGHSVSDAGDINGDGFDDVIVGADLYEPGGIALIYYGSPSGVLMPADTLRGNDSQDDEFGRSVSSAGDINNDGYDDIIIGAPDNDGNVFIYMGSDTGIAGVDSLISETASSTTVFGLNVSGAGDVNGDGYDDVIVSTPYYLYLAIGKIWIYHGSSSGLNPIAAATRTGSGYYGNSASGAGDVNNDGYDDIVVGDYRGDDGEESEGLVLVYYGSPSGINFLSSSLLQLNEEENNFGYSVSGAGDVNGDGFDDIIAGSYRYSSTDDLNWEGKATVFHGSAAGIESTPSISISTGQKNAQGGYSVSSAGDVNNDGYDDIIFSAPYYDYPYDEGRAFVYFGSASGIDTSWHAFMQTDDYESHLGISVSSAGDINHDGYSDMIVGAPDYDIPGTGTGAAFIYYGKGCLNVYYADADADSFGDAAVFVNACIAPAGYLIDHTDCDDTKPYVHPFAEELCNSLDDNCNGLIDEDAVLSAEIIPSGSVTYCKPGSVLLQATTGLGYVYQWKQNGMNIPGATSSSYTSVNKTAYYQVQITSPACFDISDSLLITANPKITATITNIDATNNLCIDPGIKLKANGGSGISWQWYKGANPIAGATGQAYIATTTGNYKVKTTNTSGCSKTSAPYTIINVCREAENTLAQTSLNLFPNPVDELLIVDLLLAPGEGIATWDICDVNGKKILSGKYDPEERGTMEINVSTLSAGLYLFSVSSQNFWSKEFIKL